MLQFTATALVFVFFSAQGTEGVKPDLQGVIKIGNLSINFLPKPDQKSLMRKDLRGADLVTAVLMDETNADGSPNITIGVYMGKLKNEPSISKKGPQADRWCTYEVVRNVNDLKRVDVRRSRNCVKTDDKNETAIKKEVLGEFFQILLEYITGKRGKRVKPFRGERLENEKKYKSHIAISPK